MTLPDWQGGRVFGHNKKRGASAAHTLSVDNEARALCSEGACPFDLVVTDLHMHPTNGLELIRWLLASENTKHLPILVLSSEPEPGLAAGADYTLQEPYHLHELVIVAIGEMVKRRVAHQAPEGEPILINTTLVFRYNRRSHMRFVFFSSSMPWRSQRLKTRLYRIHLSGS